LGGRKTIHKPSHHLGCPTSPKDIHFLSAEVHRELHSLGQTHPPAQPDNELKVDALPSLYADNFVPGDEMEHKVATETPFLGRRRIQKRRDGNKPAVAQED
jgi:hypothetical protein